MKNKKFLVIIATALMACLVVGMGAMTYSRYITTQDVPEQSATAAKWGFVVSADADNLFGTEYKITDSEVTATTSSTGDVVVEAAADAKIVAPGTSGSLSINVAGTAEVKAKLTLSVKDGAKDLHLDAYYPIVWTLDVDGAKTTYANLAALNTGLSTEVGETIDPNESFASNVTISWEWKFHVDDDTDVKDSIIGILSDSTYHTTYNSVYGTTYDSPLAAANGIYGTTYTAEQYSTSLAFVLSIAIEQVQ